MTIVRYEPWTLLSRFQRQFERALGETPEDAPSPSVSWIPHVDIREEAERFVVVADLPGVEAKDINVTAERGVLAVRGERRSQKQSSGDGYERVERASGTFLRRFTLPESAGARRSSRGASPCRLPETRKIRSGSAGSAFIALPASPAACFRLEQSPGAMPVG
ncbi:MAG: Hsp20/alpha crystallin family protein [Gammaproteobacteria bacterium]|nr:MAG: Hsp20/alpha crystallin family protein [Gammaproteobacteria bacterium]